MQFEFDTDDSTAESADAVAPGSSCVCVRMAIVC